MNPAKLDLKLLMDLVVKQGYDDMAEGMRAHDGYPNPETQYLTGARGPRRLRRLQDHRTAPPARLSRLITTQREHLPKTDAVTAAAIETGVPALAKDVRTEFRASPFAFNETIPYPTFGLGASFRLRPLVTDPGVYVVGTLNDMNGDPEKPLVLLTEAIDQNLRQTIPRVRSRRKQDSLG